MGGGSTHWAHMAEEENFGELSFVPYVIQVGDALDDEDGEEVKPSLPVPMIFDEVERQGPDEIIDLEEEEEEVRQEIKSRPRRGKRRESGKGLEKEHNRNIENQLVSCKANLKPMKKKKKEQKKQTSKKKTTQEVKKRKDGDARKVERELSETKRRVEQLLKENAKLSKENEALRTELQMNENQLSRMTSESKALHAKLETVEEEKRRIKNIVKTERKRAKTIMELSSLSSQEVILILCLFFIFREGSQSSLILCSQI